MTKIIDRDDIEIRLRRIETRLTKYMEWQGFDIQALKPTWRDGRINIPSVGTPLKEILTTIPESWDKNEDVWIYHRGKFVTTLNISELELEPNYEMEPENA